MIEQSQVLQECARECTDEQSQQSQQSQQPNKRVQEVQEVQEVQDNYGIIRYLTNLKERLKRTYPEDFI